MELFVEEAAEQQNSAGDLGDADGINEATEGYQPHWGALRFRKMKSRVFLAVFCLLLTATATAKDKKRRKKVQHVRKQLVDGLLSAVYS